MALSITTLAALAVAVLVVYKGIIYPVFKSPLSKIPNVHWSVPLSPVWMLWKRFSSQNNRTIQAAHESLGPIVRLGPSEISINCVDGGIKSVYTGGFEKHDWYPRVFGSFGTVSMFTMTGSKAHSTRKRMLSNIYSKSTLQTSPHLRVVSNAVIFGRLLPILHEAATSNQQVDVHDLNQGLTMDFVSSYLFGLQNGTNHLQDHSFRKNWLHLYLCRKPYEFYHQEVPHLSGWMKCLGIRLIPKYCDDANAMLDAWALDLCDKAEQSLTSTEPGVEPVVYKQLRQSLDKHSSKETGSKPDRAQQRLDIACEMYDHLTAGYETSAVGLTYLLWELSKHPEVQRKLQKELLTLQPPISYSASTELPPPKSIDSLSLLEAIVTETLRLHAPIPGIQPRVTPYPSCTLAGYDDIPPNTRVNAQAYSLHRNPDVFPAPESWQPKRWLVDENSPVDLEERRRWFWAFGSGGRMCVGSNLALQGMDVEKKLPSFGVAMVLMVKTEMKLAVAAIYTNFRTTIVDDENVEATDAYTVKPRGDKLILKFELVGAGRE
ncbi:Cytochrome P450 [Penicillium alfredii]|uniref:Cytochrome P450 n=1 Tax=Penicillium alfredii TaxID=1506179 RepID=A0A9W9JX08_9EURO|nr:Cytochrome P450 [Penicillium alfredii]KAJ5084718.1 Cytochrome P450 [Penicillium alfredii]